MATPPKADTESSPDTGTRAAASGRKAVSAAAQRALAEAAERRAARDTTARSSPREINGRDGPDPVRYGDWENKGIASDF